MSTPSDQEMLQETLERLNGYPNDTPAQAVARLLKQWAAALSIPSGPFVNDDLSMAARFVEQQAAELAQIRAAAGEWKMVAVGREETTRQAIDHMKASQARAEAAEASLTQAREVAGGMLGALRECAEDLACEVEGRYAAYEGHPAMKSRYERDMAPAVRARAAITRARAAGIKEG